MITGGDGNGEKASNNDVFIIDSLMKNALGKPTTTKFDDYVYSTFQCFVQNKQQIILDLDGLNDTNNKMRELIMYPLDGANLKKGEKEKKRDIADFINIFRSETFKILKNVKNVIIMTTDVTGEISYSLSLSLLLSLIKSTSLEKVIVKATTFNGNDSDLNEDDDEYDSDKEYNWIFSLWSSSSSIIKKEYDESNYIISMREVDHDYQMEYWFVINKKN